jgi:hypothetical protein
MGGEMENRKSRNRNRLKKNIRLSEDIYAFVGFTDKKR